MNRTRVHRSGKGLKRASFSLIELLVVVAIILVLVGIALRVMSMVNRKAATASTLRILEQVKHALAAYYSAYGVYPPVDRIDYEYEGTDPGGLPALPPDLYYKTGVCFYVIHGEKHNTESISSPWQHYLEGLIANGMPDYSTRVGFATVAWTNNYDTIKDAWGATLVYQCRSLDPGCQRFVLKSVGGPSVIEVTSGE